MVDAMISVVSIDLSRGIFVLSLVDLFTCRVLQVTRCFLNDNKIWKTVVNSLLDLRQ
jgi:hypothetical protein